LIKTSSFHNRLFNKTSFSDDFFSDPGLDRRKNRISPADRNRNFDCVHRRKYFVRDFVRISGGRYQVINLAYFVNAKLYLFLNTVDAPIFLGFSTEFMI
jgi:hypothetical protein